MDCSFLFGEWGRSGVELTRLAELVMLVLQT